MKTVPWPCQRTLLFVPQERICLRHATLCPGCSSLDPVQKRTPWARSSVPASTRPPGTKLRPSWDTIGPTVSDAFRMMMRRIVAERRLPFEPLVPNATTVAAIGAARPGELETAGSIDSVFEQLDRDDVPEIAPEPSDGFDNSSAITGGSGKAGTETPPSVTCDHLPAPWPMTSVSKCDVAIMRCPAVEAITRLPSLSRPRADLPQTWPRHPQTHPPRFIPANSGCNRRG